MSDAEKATMIKKGWQFRGNFNEPRLSEVAAMYREIGLEVCLRPWEPDTDKSCRQCLQADPRRFRSLYTRPPATSAGGDSPNA